MAQQQKILQEKVRVIMKVGVRKGRGMHRRFVSLHRKVS